MPRSSPLADGALIWPSIEGRAAARLAPAHSFTKACIGSQTIHYTSQLAGQTRRLHANCTVFAKRKGTAYGWNSAAPKFGTDVPSIYTSVSMYRHTAFEAVQRQCVYRQQQHGRSSGVLMSAAVLGALRRDWSMLLAAHHMRASC